MTLLWPSMTYLHLIIIELSFPWSCKHKGFVHFLSTTFVLHLLEIIIQSQVSFFSKCLGTRKWVLQWTCMMLLLTSILLHAGCDINNLQVDCEGEQNLKDAMMMRHTYLKCTWKNWKHELLRSLIITTHQHGFFQGKWQPTYRYECESNHVMHNLPQSYMWP